MEYALKVAGHNRGNGPAEADWSKFARSIEKAIDDRPLEIAESVEFILTQPPKKQYISNNKLEWRDLPANTGSQVDDLFIYIRRIRNNLFHGGKFNGRWFAPERSEQLMSAALIIMHWTIKTSPSVRAAYHE